MEAEKLLLKCSYVSLDTVVPYKLGPSYEALKTFR